MSPYQRIKEQLWEENQNIVKIHFLLGNLGRGQGFLVRMKWDHLQGMHIKQMGHTGLPVPLVLQGRGQDMEQLMGILEMQSGKKDIKKPPQEGWNSTGNSGKITAQSLDLYLYLYLYWCLYIFIILYVYLHTTKIYNIDHIISNIIYKYKICKYTLNINNNEK